MKRKVKRHLRVGLEVRSFGRLNQKDVGSNPTPAIKNTKGRYKMTKDMKNMIFWFIIIYGLITIVSHIMYPESEKAKILSEYDSDNRAKEIR